ncbi:hypothetical protein EC968_005226 [Mortierella alpina]|nr:hypothetical protein EC968_005226 [Mortierella alpina]
MRLVGAAVARIPEGKIPKVLFAWSNGTFRSGCNLTSTHMTLQQRLVQKARERRYLVLLVDEYLTSTMCPTCAAVAFIGEEYVRTLGRPTPLHRPL